MKKIALLAISLFLTTNFQPIESMEAVLAGEAVLVVIEAGVVAGAAIATLLVHQKR